LVVVVGELVLVGASPVVVGESHEVDDLLLVVDVGVLVCALASTANADSTGHHQQHGADTRRETTRERS
jgi:hypothetical protein